MKVLSAAFALILLFSCKHSSIIPDVAVSFSLDVMPIVSGNCGDTGCHGDNNYEAVKLTTYDEVMGLVREGKPHDSRLYQVMVVPGEEGLMPPKPRLPVGTDQIKVIYAWILQGAPNN